MSADLEILITLILFLALLAGGMAVPFAVMVPAIIYLLMQGGLHALNGLGLVAWGSMYNFTLTAIPLFMLMAEILSVSGLSSRIYGGLSKLVAVLPGGLLQTNIAGCAIFASVSGSSVATAASIGSVALPQLTGRAYNRALAAGSLAAGGTLGILIPPSFAMIIYGTYTETSVPKLFMAGVVPGLITTALFMGYIALRSLLSHKVAPREQGPRSFGEFLRALADVVPFAIIVGGTLGGLYMGLVTTTEAAAIGCVLAILLGAVWGELTPRAFLLAIGNTVRFTGNILFLILAAYVLSSAMSFAGVGQQITEFIVSLDLTRLQFFVAIFLLYTVLGCFIESLGMIVITLPLIFPLLSAYDIDPILFGVLVVMFAEVAQISPPMGINLFVIQSIWDGKLNQVIRGALPFMLILLAVLVMLVTWPQLALWLPARM